MSGDFVSYMQVFFDNFVEYCKNIQTVDGKTLGRNGWLTKAAGRNGSPVFNRRIPIHSPSRLGFTMNEPVPMTTLDRRNVSLSLSSCPKITANTSPVGPFSLKMISDNI